MRGSDKRSGSLFSYVDLEARVRSDHLLRRIRAFADTALEALSGEFSKLYAARMGRPSIAPEMLLRAMLLQAFYSIRSERQLMERLEFDLLFRWFVGLGIDDAAWDHSTFSKNRDRLLEGEIAAKFLAAVLAQPKVRRLCPPITSASTARWWPERRRRASDRRPRTLMICRRPRLAGPTPTSTSRARSARIRPT